ncbi:MAG TPA: CHRD domain-containing protein [Xanthobacteraceae bacterium]|jgi:hypothetical protein|nr:CHRD domain-containing protein [Xanthobacteraceae bacterium]
MVRILALAIASVAYLIISPASAETVTFKAALSGKNEVPPNDSPAAGQAEATLDTATKVLTYTVTYAGLTGPSIGAHLHGPGEHGKNAGIVIPFNFVASPIKGTATLNDTQIADLIAGRWYVNVHTSAHPGGELRGQLLK